MIDDRRTPEERAETWAYVVCTDAFLSGSGLAPGRSLYALAARDPREAEILLDNARRRSDMRRPRLNLNLPRLRPGDHLAIVGPSTAARWYQREGF